MAQLVTVLIALPLLYGAGLFYWRLGVWVCSTLWPGGRPVVAIAPDATPGGGSMPEEPSTEFPTRGNGPRYDYSAAAAAEIINLYVNSSQPKEVLYGRILFTILNAMNLAEKELERARWMPSEN